MRNMCATLFHRSHFCAISTSLLCATTFIYPTTSSYAQTLRVEKKESVAKEVDPSDIFFQAHVKLRNGEKLVAKEDYIAAWKDYKAALKYYSNLQATHPMWKADVIDYRVKDVTKRLENLKPLAKKQAEAAQNKVADMLDGGEKLDLENFKFTVSGELKGIIDEVARVQKDIAANKKRYDRERTVNEAHLQAAQSKLAIFKKKNQKDPAKARVLKKEIDRIEAIIEENKKYSSTQDKKLSENLKNLQSQLRKHSAAPLREDLLKKDAELKKKQQELVIVSRGLIKWKAKAETATKQLEEKQTQLDSANGEIAQLKQQLKKQSKDATKVVKSLYKKLDEAKKKQLETEKELVKAKTMIADLTGELDKQRELNKDLTEELKEVREDRDRLQDLLLKDPDKRIAQVVKQNISLIEELKEKKETLKRVIKDQSDDQERLIAAERDLAVAKQKILDQQKQTKADTLRIKQLQMQLSDIDTELKTKRGSGKLTTIEREELTELRKTSQKLLNKHRFVQKKYDLLKKQVIKSSKEQVLIDLVNNSVSPELLTEKEQKLIRKSDATITTFTDLSKAQREMNAQRMEAKVDSYRNVARMLISNDRLLAARVTLHEANDELPNHFPTLMDLGCVNMRLRDFDKAEEHFKDGIVMQKHNPYAHYMLGMCYFNKREDDLAEKSLKHSLGLNNAQSKAHFYMGTIAGMQNRLDTAEDYFKDAIRYNPEMGHAYFALSVNYFLKKDIKNAQDFYQEALKNGYPPNPSHEKKIGL